MKIAKTNPNNNNINIPRNNSSKQMWLYQVVIETFTKIELDKNRLFCSKQLIIITHCHELFWMMWLNLILFLISIKISISPKINELRATITEQDQRAFIKCHVLLGDPPQEIYHMLQKIARRKALTQKTV